MLSVIASRLHTRHCSLFNVLPFAGISKQLPQLHNLALLYNLNLAHLSPAVWAIFQKNIFIARLSHLMCRFTITATIISVNCFALNPSSISDRLRVYCFTIYMILSGVFIVCSPVPRFDRFFLIRVISIIHTAYDAIVVCAKHLVCSFRLAHGARIAYVGF